MSSKSDIIRELDKKYGVLTSSPSYDSIESYKESIGAGKGKNYENNLVKTQNKKGVNAQASTTNEDSGKSVSDLKSERDERQKETIDVDAAKSKYEQTQKEYDEKLSLDLDAYSQEITELESLLEKYKSATQGSDFIPKVEGQTEMETLMDLVDSTENEINQKKQYLTQAQRVQEKARLSSVADSESENYDPYFEELSRYLGSDHTDKTYEYINNQSSREQLNREQKGYGSNKYRESSYESAGYDYMSEDEVRLYNYYYSKGGAKSAQAYLDTIQEELNQRKATGMYQKIKGQTGKEMLFGVGAGFDKFESGVKGAARAVKGDDSYVAPSATQYASGMVREDLADDGFKLPSSLGGASLGQVGYDVITTTANMAPSILTSSVIGLLNPAAGATAGKLMTSVSAAGSGYLEMINEGYTKNQARLYGIGVGAAEYFMESALGGISKLGGAPVKAITKWTENVDNALFKFALNMGGSGFSEGLGEGLTDVVIGWLKSKITKEDFYAEPADVLYNSLLGMATGILFEGPSVTYDISQQSSQGREVKAAKGVETLKEMGQTSSDSVTRDLANRISSDSGNFAVGKLARKIESETHSQNSADIASSLSQKGMPEKTAKQYGDKLAYMLEAGSDTEIQRMVMESDPVIGQTLREIQMPDSKVYQRSQNLSAARGKTQSVDRVAALYGQQAEVKKTDTQQNKQDQKIADIVAAITGKAQETGTVSNKDANQILTDPEAVATLEQESGRTIEGSNSEKRSLVKEIVKNLAQQQNNAQEATQQPQVEAQQAEQTTEAPQTQREVQGQSVVQEAQQMRTSGGDTQTGAVDASTERTQPGMLGMQNAASGDVKQSRTFTNTGLRSADADIRKAYTQTMENDPDAADYEVKHNKDTLTTAQERTQTVEQAETESAYLTQKDWSAWTAEDNVTSMLAIKKLMKEGGENAAGMIADLSAKRREVNVNAGQVVQSNSIIGTMKAADNTETAVDTFINAMEGMNEKQTTYSKKSGKDFETWKRDIETAVTDIGIAIELVEDGDSGAMRDVIRQIAKQRKTTANFGTSDNLTRGANRILNKLDFDTLKKIANTQVASMADDYRKRSKSEVATGLRKQSMLSALKTIARNTSGNTVGGIADAVSESGAGRLADTVMSKFTGKKTVGSDVFQTKEYATAAKDAGEFASLCVELNIPIETDVDSSFDAASGNNGGGKYIGKTFRSTGNPAMRFLYAYQKYMSYGLEVTDKIFEGGTNAAVEASLNKLKHSNLTGEDVEALSDFTAQKRTFKDATWQDTDSNGNTVERGSRLSRGAAKLQDATGVVGEVVSPFVSTPMNVAQTGIDYTAGVVKGIYEMATIIKDAKNGKTIPVERQRQAASDFGRGLTGTTMIGLFAAAAASGALKVTDPEDWDEEALAKAEGRSGAQINWDALARSLKGEDGSWKSGDVVSSVDFLEPFNTQMYLGYELAEFEKDADEETTWLDRAAEYGKASAKSVWNSLMDSPVMTGLQDIVDLKDDITEAGEDVGEVWNAVAAYGGDVASSYIPQVVRQTAQHTDGYYRDTKGDNAAETALNSIKAAIPGLSQTLPKKYSGLGEEQTRGSWLETFADPTGTFRYEENKVTTYLEELSDRTGDASVFPSRQAPVRIEVGGETVELDSQQRETYQKTYGEKVSELYSSLISTDDFEKLPDELKTEAFKEAEGYARQTAMAAVSDYKDAPKKITQALTTDAIANSVRSAISGALSDVDTAREYGRSTEKASQSMEDFFQVFTSLSSSAKKNIEDNATGDTARYLEVRQDGVTTSQFLKTTERVNNLRPELGKSTVSNVQKWNSVAGTSGMSSSAVDILMKAYMDDYDPNAKSSDKTELKYDYARQELRLSPKQFVKVYEASLEGQKDENISEWIRMGYTEEQAEQFYYLFQSTSKTKKIDVVAWSKKKK